MATDKRIRIILDSKDAEKNANSLDKSVKSVGKSADGVAFAMKGLAVAISAAIAVQKVVEYADAWTMVQNQLKRTTNSQKELTETSLALLKVANDTRNALDTTVDLYTSLTVSTKNLNLSQEKTLAITKTINNLFLESGKSAAETAGSVRQLGQALQSGALRGDEFNSVAEGAPGILRAIQKETGKTASQLRDLAADGKISAELIVKSLENYGEAAQKAADKTNVTLGQALVVAKNNLTAFIGTVDSASGASNTFASSIVSLSNKLGDPAFLQATTKLVKALGNDFSTGLAYTTADLQFLFDTMKAGFGDTTIDAAIEKRTKAIAELTARSVQNNIDSGVTNPQSNMKRPTGKGKVLSPAEKVAPTKEELAAAKKAFNELLDIQSEFWDAVDAEGKSRDAASREIKEAQAVTANLRIELDKRIQISQIYRDQALNADNDLFSQQRAMQKAKELEDIANLQASAAEASQRRAEQLRQALENTTLEESEKNRIKAEYQIQEQLQAQINQEQLTAIEQEGTRARIELARAERDAKTDLYTNLANTGLQIIGTFGKKSFQAQKNLAIAEGTIAIVSGTAKALNNPYPANLGFAASVALAGAKLIQTIRSTNPAGGGGSIGTVSAGSSGSSGSIPSTANSSEGIPQQKKIYDLRGVKSDDKISISAMAALLEDDGAVVLIENAREDAARRNVIGVTAR